MGPLVTMGSILWCTGNVPELCVSKASRECSGVPSQGKDEDPVQQNLQNHIGWKGSLGGHQCGA